MPTEFISSAFPPHREGTHPVRSSIVVFCFFVFSPMWRGGEVELRELFF